MDEIRVGEDEAQAGYDEVVRSQEQLEPEDGDRIPAELLIAYFREASVEPLGDSVVIVDECEEDVPYAPMWIRRTADGELERVCGHSPEHVTKLATG